MTRNVKRAFRPTRWRNVLYFALLIAAGVAVGPTAAQIQRCPFCTSLQTLHENFDSVTPPALPADWLATNALGPPPLWVTSNSGVPSPPADTPPNAAFIDDPAVVSDKRLDSLQFSFFESTRPQLIFRHNFNLEASPTDQNVGFDGGVLEISSDGGNTFKIFLLLAGALLWAVTTVLSPRIGAVRLLVVRHGATTRAVSSRL